MTDYQWEALRAFGDKGLTVPQVLFKLIGDRRCPALREFFELVIKAFDAGILEVPRQPKAATAPSVPWHLEVPASWVSRLAVLVTVTLGVGLVRHEFTTPFTTDQILIAWGLVCLALSLGNLFAACVLRDLGSEVYRPRLVWRTPFPHFGIDAGDAVMSGRKAEVVVGGARLLPLLAAVGISLFLDGGVALLLLYGLLFQVSPFWWSPGLKILHARFSAPQLDTFRRFRFAPNRVSWAALRLRLKGADVPFLRIHVAASVLWLALVLVAGSLPLHNSARDLWRNYQEMGGVHFTALGLLVLFAVIVVATLAWIGWLALLECLRRWVRRRGHLRRPKHREFSREAVTDVLATSLLFRNLEPVDREALIDHLQAEEYPARSIVIREGDPGDRLFLVLTGQVEVLRNLPSGRVESVARLEPGDVFGEIALLDASPRTRSVRTRPKSVLLSLDRDAFHHFVLSKLSRSEVLDIIQKVAFMHRVPLSENWSPHALYAFARRCSFQSFGEGDLLIRENEDNQFFFILYEGAMSVRRHGKEIARLKVGDFFGEISALQNSTAVATIQSSGPARCLVMSKREFLQFLVNDFCIGLQFEEMSSKRLGQPLFPLSESAFDLFRA